MTPRRRTRVSCGMVVLKAMALWAAIVPLAVLNGALREGVLARVMSERSAHQVSCFTGAGLVLLVAWLGARWLGLRRWPGLLGVGCLWLALTVAFEFAFGRLVVGAGWDRLLADYRVDRGRLWPVVLLTTLLAPWIAARIRGVGP